MAPNTTYSRDVGASSLCFLRIGNAVEPDWAEFFPGRSKRHESRQGATTRNAPKKTGKWFEFPGRQIFASLCRLTSTAQSARRSFNSVRVIRFRSSLVPAQVGHSTEATTAVPGGNDRGGALPDPWHVRQTRTASKLQS
jgi:hypothetical protein